MAFVGTETASQSSSNPLVSGRMTSASADCVPPSLTGSSSASGETGPSKLAASSATNPFPSATAPVGTVMGWPTSAYAPMANSWLYSPRQQLFQQYNPVFAQALGLSSYMESSNTALSSALVGSLQWQQAYYAAALAAATNSQAVNTPISLAPSNASLAQASPLLYAQHSGMYGKYQTPSTPPKSQLSSSSQAYVAQLESQVAMGLVRTKLSPPHHDGYNGKSRPQGLDIQGSPRTATYSDSMTDDESIDDASPPSVSFDAKSPISSPRAQGKIMKALQEKNRFSPLRGSSSTSSLHSPKFSHHTLTRALSDAPSPRRACRTISTTSTESRDYTSPTRTVVSDASSDFRSTTSMDQLLCAVQLTEPLPVPGSCPSPTETDDKYSYACPSCGTRRTPIWRDVMNGVKLCNACGLRYRCLHVICTSCQFVPHKWELRRTVAKCRKCSATLPKIQTSPTRTDDEE